MPRPIFSDKFIQAERELEQKELQAALSRVQDGDWLTSSKRSIYEPSTRSVSLPGVDSARPRVFSPQFGLESLKPLPSLYSPHHHRQLPMSR